ncbi:MAG: uroporphyrinogen decarboxylase family protein [Armatimonadetes bacterium]|nr:uroporphyrinogen decarboxylase family protein [Armatimonadota bacterium]
MTPKERVDAAFSGEITDRIPVCHIGISSDVASALLGREAYVGGGIQRWREATALWRGEDAHQEFLERSYRDAIAVSKLLGNDVIRASYWRHSTKPTRQIDDCTFLFEYGEERHWNVMHFDPPSEQCHITSYLPEAEPTFEDIEKSLEQEEREIADYRPSGPGFEMRALREMGDDYVIRCGAAGVGIPLEESQVWLMAVAARPDLVARRLDLQVESARLTVPLLASLGFKYLFGGGDFGSNDGPMYSPRAFRELMLPRLRQVSEICHQHGCYHLFASDGNLWAVADDLFGASGVDGYYEIDGRAGMDLRKLHGRFPNLTTIGNISSHTVHLGTKEDIVREVEEAMAEGKRFGRTVVGVSNALVPGTPVQNVIAMLEAVKAFR